MPKIKKGQANNVAEAVVDNVIAAVLPKFKSVDQIYLLEDRYLLVRGWIADHQSSKGDFSLKVAGSDVAAIMSVATVRYARPDVEFALSIQPDSGITPDGTSRLGFYVAFELPESARDRVLSSTLIWSNDVDGVFEVTRINLPEAAQTLATITTLYDSEPAQLGAVFAAINCIPSVLCESRLKPYTSGGLSFTAAVDSVLSLGKKEVLIVGWLIDPLSSVTAIFANAKGTAAKVLKGCDLHRFDRPDLMGACTAAGLVHTRVGMLVKPSISESVKSKSDLELIVLLKSGQMVRLPEAIEWVTARDWGESFPRLLERVSYDTQQTKSVVASFIAPVLDELLTEVRVSFDHAGLKLQIRDFRPSQQRPEFSLIVPLYGRWDLAMYQLAEFANDPLMRSDAVEIIFVCDDNRIKAELERRAADWSRIYGLSFCFVSYGEHLGYVVANNVGATVARGKSLIFMHSDVIPKQKGWLDQLRTRRSELERGTLVGAKIFYFDGSLQNAGYSFVCDPDIMGGLATASVRGRGLPDYSESLRSMNMEKVEAVSGAFMVISRSFFQRVDGFSRDYVGGEFSDFDFCMKVKTHGGGVALASDIEMIHLERMSASYVPWAEWRAKVVHYNAWMFERRWMSGTHSVTKGV